MLNFELNINPFLFIININKHFIANLNQKRINLLFLNQNPFKSKVIATCVREQICNVLRPLNTKTFVFSQQVTVKTVTYVFLHSRNLELTNPTLD